MPLKSNDFVQSGNSGQVPLPEAPFCDGLAPLMIPVSRRGPRDRLSLFASILAHRWSSHELTCVDGVSLCTAIVVSTLCWLGGGQIPDHELPGALELLPEGTSFLAQ